VFRAIIAEGTPVFRQVLINIFHSRFPSVEWAEAANGKDAIGLIETFLPDLILVDIKLPGGNALELTRMIKMHHPKVVVIILGSYDFPEYRDMANLKGADYFIYSIGLFLSAYLGLITSLYPYAIPPTVTLEQAAAQRETLFFTLWGVVIVLPLVAGYIIYSYSVFRGKVSHEEYY
jgi:cytochrome bd-type quinol oxidase subunit 2